MPTKVQGDYSRLPEAIREIFPYFYGEACEMRNDWVVYKHLYMSGEERVELLGTALARVFHKFQILLEDDMFIRIGRMFDASSRGQQNLTLWVLAEACAKWNLEVGRELSQKTKALAARVEGIRKHRHKRVAHYDIEVSLEKSTLPTVTYGQIGDAIRDIQEIVNFVSVKTGYGTILFEALDKPAITWEMELTVFKARAYDMLEKAGTIPPGEWEKYWIK